MSLLNQRRVLLNASTGDETSAAQNLNAKYPSKITAYAYGTFSGSSAVVEVSDGTTNWIASTDLTFTSDGFKEIRGAFGKVRGKIGSGGANTSVTLVCYAPFTT